MTRNVYQDNRVESAAAINAIQNGFNQEAIVSGCTPSKGSGDFDVDIASGEVIEQAVIASVSSTTVTLSTSASDDRVDLIHVDSSGTVASTEGTAATDPVAPDIPSGEVLIAAVLVEGGASSLNSAGSRIADYRTIYEKNPAVEELHDGTAASSKRAAFTSTATEVYDDAATQALDLADGSHYRVFARSGVPFEVQDAALGGLGVSYTAGASKPNTWDFNGHDLSNVNSVDTDKSLTSDRDATWVVRSDPDADFVAIGPNSTKTDTDVGSLVQNLIDNDVSAGDTIRLLGSGLTWSNGVTLDETIEGIEIYGGGVGFAIDGGSGNNEPVGTWLDVSGLATTTDAILLDGASNCYLHDFGMFGDGSGARDGIRMQINTDTGGPFLPRFNEIDRCVVDKVTGDGISQYGGWMNRWDMVVSHFAGGHGIYLTEGTNGAVGHDNSFGHMFAWNAQGGDQFLIDGMAQSSFWYVQVDGPSTGGGHGLRLRSNDGTAKHNSFHNVDIEEVTNDGVFVQDGSQFNNFGRIFVNNAGDQGVNVAADHTKFTKEVKTTGSGGADGMNISGSATDVEIDATLDLGQGLRNVGTRPRRRGVVGGGILGGADLSAISTNVDTGTLGQHDGSGFVPADTLAEWDGSNWRILSPVQFSYTGDGTTGRTIAGDFQFNWIVIEEAGGTVVDAYVSGLSNGAMSGGSFSGELTVESTGGFTVGDNSGDADPNTDTETYQVFAG